MISSDSTAISSLTIVLFYSILERDWKITDTGGKTMSHFSRDDLSIYNTAESPWFQIAINGKVDIGVKMGEGPKIGLSTTGMMTLIENWLKEGNISKKDKDKLKALLE